MSATTDVSSAPLAADSPAQNLDRVRAELSQLQNELDHAIQMWRDVWTTEKGSFNTLVTSQQQAWADQESAWAAQRTAYEKKIQELETFFQEQQARTENHALRALNDLEASWQRDKVLWQQTLARTQKESHQRTDVLMTQHQKQQEMIHALQQEVQSLRGRLTEVETSYASQRDDMTVHVRALESQISALNEMMRQVLPMQPLTPSDPLQERFDFVLAPETTPADPKRE